MALPLLIIGAIAASGILGTYFITKPAGEATGAVIYKGALGIGSIIAGAVLFAVIGGTIGIVLLLAMLAFGMYFLLKGETKWW